MNDLPRLSIITLTKNRGAFLMELLTSLKRQTKLGDELIILDNGSTDETPSVIDSFRPVLPIRSFVSRAHGFPNLYNLAIRKAKNPVIVFLDDDCIANPAYLAHVRSAHHVHRIAAIQGMTLSIPKGNIYADIMADHYRHFITVNTIHGNNLRVLDNKNASIRQTVLQKVGGFSPKLYRGSEDIELGIRLRAHGVPIIFDPSIVAYHHERTTFTAFMKQHFRFAQAEGYLDRLLPPRERMGLVNLQKLTLQQRSALRREVSYIRNGDIVAAVQLPFLYILLGFVRILGYVTSI